MQATLMNFGANTRVVNDSSNMPVSIGIGELKECDIHDVHFAMIRRGVGTETLLAVPKDAKRSERLIAIMDILKVIETDPLEEIIQKFHEIVPADETGSFVARPTRGQMRAALMHHARREVATALRLQSKVFIREEQTPNTPPQNPQPKVDKPDGALNADLGRVTGEEPKPKRQAGPTPIKKKAAASGKSKPAKQAAKTARKRERL